MIGRIALLSAAALLGAGTIPRLGLAQADAAREAADDTATLRDCLHEKGGHHAEECIFVIANPCVGDETAQSSGYVVDCHNREQRAWDKLLNEAYNAVRDALDDDQRIKLRDMQRAWVTSRDRSCNFIYDFFQGSMAYPMIAYCDNQETARRALFLYKFANDVKQGKQ